MKSTGPKASSRPQTIPRGDVVEDGRADEVAALSSAGSTVDVAAVEDQLGALFDALVDPARDGLLVRVGDDRAELRRGVVGGADDALGGELLHERDELVGDRVLDADHGQRHAAHAGAAEGRVDDAAGGALERGVLEHEAVVLGLRLRLDALAVRGGDAE